VLLDPPVVHEVADVDAAGGRDEVRDQPAVAAPPQALRAHHDHLASGRLGEHAVDGVEEVGRPHVLGVAAEHVLAPRHVRVVRAWLAETAEAFLPAVADARLRKPLRHRGQGELRVAPAARRGADVHQRGDSGPAQSRHGTFGRIGTVAVRQQHLSLRRQRRTLPVYMKFLVCSAESSAASSSGKPR
jgi:hypothetical protein